MVEENVMVQESLDKLEYWWQRFGKQLAALIVVGLLGGLGYSQWDLYQQRQLADASILYHQILERLEEGAELTTADQELVVTNALKLKNDYPESTYAVLGLLLKARVDVQNERLSAAEKDLRWALSREHLEGFPRSMVALHLARVLYGAGDYDSALGVLDREFSGFLVAAWHFLRADILMAMGDINEASTFYQQSQQVYDQHMPESLRLKLIDLKSREATIAQQQQLRQNGPQSVTPTSASPGVVIEPRPDAGEQGSEAEADGADSQ